MHTDPTAATCPVCQARCGIHPGEPPDTAPHQYRNRCMFYRLTGKHGKAAFNTGDWNIAWFRPERSDKICGAPVTDMDGNPIKANPGMWFVEQTRHNFDLEDLVRKVYTDERLIHLALRGY